MRRTSLSTLSPTLLLLAAFCCSPQTAEAQQPPGLFDTDLVPTVFPEGSFPILGGLLPGDRCVFRARRAAEGMELWIVEAGIPRLLKDIMPGRGGSNPRGFVSLGGVVLFTADDGLHGAELWITDGTTQGTQILIDLLPGPGGALPEELTVVQSRVFFRAFRPTEGTELWSTDGTASGTALVTDIATGPVGSFPTILTAFGSALIFAAEEATEGIELYISDGTAPGTTRLSAFGAGPLPGVNTSVRPIVAQGLLHFSGIHGALGSEPSVSDGTAAGTRLLADLRPGALSSRPTEYVMCGVHVFFRATSAAQGDELFVSDGTTAGTGLLKDIRPGSASSTPRNFACCGNQLFFVADDGVAGAELHVSDGTAAGTSRFLDLFPGASGSTPTNLLCCDGRLYFSAFVSPFGRELHVSDGSVAGTALVQDLFQGTSSSSPASLFCCGQRLLFGADRGQGFELQVLDFQTNSVTEFDLEPASTGGSSFPSNLRLIGHEQFYFTATLPGQGTELCFYDGTTTIVHDLEPGPASSDPRNLTVSGKYLFFTAQTPATGRELWFVEKGGTPSLLADHVPGSGTSNPTELTAFGRDGLIFVITDPMLGREIGVFQNGLNDGAAGLQIIDTNPGSAPSSPSSLVTITDTLSGHPMCFYSAFDPIFGTELRCTDGQFTQVALDALPFGGSSNPTVQPLIDGDGITSRVFAFTNPTSGPKEIYTLTGCDPITLQCTFQLQHQINAPLVSVNQITPGDDQSFIGTTLVEAPNGPSTELFTVDASNSFRIIDFFGGPRGSSAFGFFMGLGEDANDTGFDPGVSFIATDENHGTEPRHYDPVSGQVQTFDLRPGPESSEPSFLTNDDALFAIVNAKGSSDPQDKDLFQLNHLDQNLPFLKFADLDPNTVLTTFNPGRAIVHGDELIFGGFMLLGGLELRQRRGLGATRSSFGNATQDARLGVNFPRAGRAFKLSSKNRNAVAVFAAIAPNIRQAFPQILAGQEVFVNLGGSLIVQLNPLLNGEFEFCIPIPNDPAIQGLEFLIQGLTVELQALGAPVSEEVSNAILVALGL